MKTFGLISPSGELVQKIKARDKGRARAQLLEHSTAKVVYSYKLITLSK